LFSPITPPKTRDILGRTGSSGGGSGDAWVDVDDAGTAAAKMPAAPLHKLSSAFGAATAFISKADAWVEKHIDQMLDENEKDGSSRPAGASPTNKGGGAMGRMRGGAQRRSSSSGHAGASAADSGEGEEGDEWTEVGVPMSPEVAEALGAVRAAMNPSNPQTGDNSMLL
jgi:hypothetical protein